MINKDTSIMVLGATHQICELIMRSLAELNFRKVTMFTSGKEAYEVAIRQQFGLFVTQLEVPDINGFVFIQKIRETGNYGIETHLFLVDKVDDSVVNSVWELDLPYVVSGKLAKPVLLEKLKFLIDKEAHLSEDEQLLRDARSAFFNNILEMAEFNVDQLLAKNENFEKALILKGDILTRNKNYPEARKYFDKALAVNPKSAEAAHKIGYLHMCLGEHKEAAELFDKIAELNKYNIKLLENAGLSNFNIQDYAKAETFMNKVNTLDEENSTATEKRAEIKIKQGDFTNAFDILMKSHSEQEIISFMNNTGVSLSKNGDIEGALKLYKTCLEKLEKNPYLHVIHYNIGLAYKKMPDVVKAKKAFEKAISLKPDFEKAKVALTNLGAT